MKFLTRCRLVCLLVILLAAVAAQAREPGSFTTIDVKDAILTQALGINPAGNIVGLYYDASGQEHGFMLRGQTFSTIDYPHALWTEAWGISPQGIIVGQYGLADANGNWDAIYHSYLLREDQFFPIDVTGLAHPSPNTMAVKISSTGEIVGCYHVGTPTGATLLGTMYGFVLNAEGYSSFNLSRTMHNGVNAEGDVVGALFDANGFASSSYVIRNGVESWFAFSGAKVTRAQDISATGDVVGFYRDAANKIHGFLVQRDDLASVGAACHIGDPVLDRCTIDAPGASVTQTQAYGINPAGDIVGAFKDGNGMHGFLRAH